jgi:hypothetical protein
MPDTNATQTSAAGTLQSASNVDSSTRGSMRALEHSEMKQWAEGLKIKKPISRDLLPILAKDDDKQMEILMKNTSLDKR